MSTQQPPTAQSILSARVENLIDVLRRSFADSYRVDDEMRGGGMSRLFRATDLALNRTVVIKILPPELTSDMMIARLSARAKSLRICSTPTSCRSSPPARAMA
jgi:hypothetical protein